MAFFVLVTGAPTGVKANAMVAKIRAAMAAAGHGQPTSVSTFVGAKSKKNCAIVSYKALPAQAVNRANLVTTLKTANIFS